jgi:hypothetical protein
MAAVIQIDERLQHALPARARLKLRRLLDLARDAEAAHMAAVSRGERLREEMGVINSERRQFIARAAETLAKDETPDTGEFDRAIEQLQEELTRLAAQIKQREDKRMQAAMLVGALRGFLEQASLDSQPLTSVQHPPAALRADETPPAALRRVRNEIAALERELIELRKASLPSAELKLKVRDYIHQLALAGTPHLMAERGECRIDWPPGCQTPMGVIGPGAAAVMAWLFADQMVARLDEQIDALRGAGLSSSERVKKEGQLKDRLLTLQRTEESLIETHEAEFDLPRRPQAAPEAILGVRFGLPAMARAS